MELGVLSQPFVTAHDFSLQARRSTRVPMRVPVRLAIQEAGNAKTLSAWTLVLNKHGARIESKQSLQVGQEVTVTVPATGKSEVGRVVWRDSRANAGGNFEAAVELKEAANLWGIDFPPSDWNVRRAGAGDATRPPADVAVEVAESPAVFELVAESERALEVAPAAPVAVAEASPAAEAEPVEQPVAASVAVEERTESLPEFPVAPPEPQASPAASQVAEHLDLTSELAGQQQSGSESSAVASPGLSLRPLPMISRYMNPESFNATLAALLNALLVLLERKGYVTRDELLAEIRRFSE